MKNQDDHDLLIRIDENVTHVRQWSISHKEEDDKRHQDNLEKFDRINKTIGFHQKIVYGGMGIFVAIDFLSKFIK